MSFSFPDSRKILSIKLDGATVDGHGPITVYWQLGVDFGKTLPALHIVQLAGIDNVYERTDRFRLSYYAEGTAAREGLQAVFDLLMNTWHEADGEPGLIDTVSSEATPADVPYASDRINQADAVIRAVVRAL